jgi:hypothetical protein
VWRQASTHAHERSSVDCNRSFAPVTESAVLTVLRDGWQASRTTLKFRKIVAVRALRAPHVLLRSLLLTTVLGLSLTCGAATAHASAVLPDTTSPPLAIVDLQTAVASSPFGSTRWSRLTVEGTARALWLVPARPGAAVDWSADAWLEALEDATAPRVIPPPLAPEPPRCTTQRPITSTRIPAWHRVGAKRSPTAITSHTTEASLRDLAGQRGFAIPSAVAPRIADLYARGWTLVAFELDPSGATISSPTVRVSDDGPGILPFALAGGAAIDTRMTVFTIGDRPMTIARASEIDPASLVWSEAGSDYLAHRATVLGQAPTTWLRESASHDIVFDGLAVSKDAEIAPLARTYFSKVVGADRLDCAEAARSASGRDGVVGRSCAPGLVLRVSGGAACVPKAETIDVAAFTCNGSADDLALALNGTAPSVTVVTRLSGRIAGGTFGHDETLVDANARRSPVIAAGARAPCSTPDVSTSDSPRPSLTPPRITIPPEPTKRDEETAYVESDSCSSSAGSAYYADYQEESAVEGCAAVSADDSSDVSDDNTDSSDVSGSDSSDATDGDSSGDDSSDDSSDDSDSSDDGSDWGDDSESASLHPKAVKSGVKTHAHPAKPTTMRRIKKRRDGASPVSRMALLLGAIALPFRRRRRSDSGDRDDSL